MPTILETFDQPAMNPNCAERSESTIVTQPLHLLNNAMIHHLAGDFARRVERDASDDLAGKVQRAWLLALNEQPTDEDVSGGVKIVEDLSAAWEKTISESGENESAEKKAFADFCHTLINSAGFLYVD